MTDPQTPGLLASVPSGSAADTRLREALATLRDNAPDERMSQMIDRVLAGKASLSDVVMTPEFDALASRGLREYEDRLAEMTPEERDEFRVQAELNADRIFEGGSRDDL